jgi:hypothetical protein
MPMFDAGNAVEALDWDFSTLKNPATGKPYVNARGSIPEPSDVMIGEFLDGLKKLYQEARELVEAGENADATPGEMLEALNSLTGAMFVDQMASIAGLFDGLCSGKPGREQLLALPLRARSKFYGYVQNEVVNPEAGTGAGTAVVKPLRPAAAG